MHFSFRSLSNLSSNNNNNFENNEDHEMENHSQKWNLSKVSNQTIYQSSLFNFKKNYSMETLNHWVSLQNKVQAIQLFDHHAVKKHMRKNYKYLHLGFVQVAVRTLWGEELNRSILLCLRDIRVLDFNDSLLSVLQSSLVDGPIYFNYFPNFTVSLLDRNIMDVLTL